LPALYARLAASARSIVGAGANSGFYELIAAAVSPNAHIFAFEPFPEACAALRQNIALNRFEDRIEALAVAMSNEVGTARLYVPAKTHGAVLEHSSSLNPDFRPEHSDVIEVPVTTLDHFVAVRGILHVDLLRADVESTEHLVLAGAAQVLEAHRPIVVMEVLADAHCAALEVVRARYGYVAYCVTERGIERCPAVAYRPRVQNQVLCPEERVAELEELGKGIGT
jgi:FkbM family methyltransferase